MLEEEESVATVLVGIVDEPCRKDEALSGIETVPGTVLTSIGTDEALPRIESILDGIEEALPRAEDTSTRDEEMCKVSLGADEMLLMVPEKPITELNPGSTMDEGTRRGSVSNTTAYKRKRLTRVDVEHHRAPTTLWFHCSDS